MVLRVGGIGHVASWLLHFLELSRHMVCVFSYPRMC